jgi:arylsulfatase A-like enzyme
MADVLRSAGYQTHMIGKVRTTPSTMPYTSYLTLAYTSGTWATMRVIIQPIEASSHG